MMNADPAAQAGWALAQPASEKYLLSLRLRLLARKARAGFAWGVEQALFGTRTHHRRTFTLAARQRTCARRRSTPTLPSSPPPATSSPPATPPGPAATRRGSPGGSRRASTGSSRRRGSGPGRPGRRTGGGCWPADGDLQRRADGGLLDSREFVLYDPAQALPVAVVTYRHADGCACSRCSNP
jgi:hypothetical protein